MISLGTLTPAEVTLVLEKMVLSGLRFGETAIQEGLIDAVILAQTLAEQFRLPYLDLDSCELSAELVASMNSSLFLQYHFIPIHQDGESLTIAVSDPTDVAALDELELLLDCSLQVQVASAAKLKNSLNGVISVLKKYCVMSLRILNYSW